MARIVITDGNDEEQNQELLERMGPKLMIVHCHERGMYLEVNGDEVPSLAELAQILHMTSLQLAQTVLEVKRDANKN